MVENLDFHTFVSSIHTHRRTDADTIVHTFLHEAEFKTEDEIAVFLLGIEIATVAILGTYTDSTVHRYIVDGIAYPLAHVFTVEQHFETFLGFFGREFELRRSFHFRKLFEHGLDIVDGITGICIAHSFKTSNRLVQHLSNLFTTQGLDILGNDGTYGTSCRFGSRLIVHVRSYNQQSLISMSATQQAQQAVLQLHIRCQFQGLAIRLELLNRSLT